MKNTSKLSKAELNALQQYSIWKPFWKIELLVLVISIGLGVMLICMGDDTAYTGASLIVYGGLFAILYPIIIVVLVKMSEKQINPTISDNTYINYDFNVDFFTETTIKDGEVIGMAKYEYFNMKQVVDYKDYLFIYITKAMACIVDKGGMTSGTVDNLIDLLQDKGIKYIKAKQNKRV